MPIQSIQRNDYLKCSICDEQFGLTQRAPISLPCGHTFCYQCLYLQKTEKCPIDQSVVSLLPDEVVVNTALLQLVGIPAPARVTMPNLSAEENGAYQIFVGLLEKIASRLNLAILIDDIKIQHVSRPIRRRILALIQCNLADENVLERICRPIHDLAERILMELIVSYQNPNQLSSNLWAAIRARGCQFLGPSVQEEVLKLILLALEDGSALSRKVIVLFVVQRLEHHFPQASKTSIGHVVQLLYRASCFRILKRNRSSSLMQLKEEYRTYYALRREHDTQIVQIAHESGLRVTPEQWSALLYGDSSHKSQMQSIMDKLQTPQLIATSVKGLQIALQRLGNIPEIPKITSQLVPIASLDQLEDGTEAITWNKLSTVISAVDNLLNSIRAPLLPPMLPPMLSPKPRGSGLKKTPSLGKVFQKKPNCNHQEFGDDPVDGEVLFSPHVVNVIPDQHGYEVVYRFHHNNNNDQMPVTHGHGNGEDPPHPQQPANMYEGYDEEDEDYGSYEYYYITGSDDAEEHNSNEEEISNEIYHQLDDINIVNYNQYLMDHFYQNNYEEVGDHNYEGHDCADHEGEEMYHGGTHNETENGVNGAHYNENGVNGAHYNENGVNGAHYNENGVNGAHYNENGANGAHNNHNVDNNNSFELNNEFDGQAAQGYQQMPNNGSPLDLVAPPMTYPLVNPMADPRLPGQFDRAYQPVWMPPNRCFFPVRQNMAMPFNSSRMSANLNVRPVMPIGNAVYPEGQCNNMAIAGPAPVEFPLGQSYVRPSYYNCDNVNQAPPDMRRPEANNDNYVLEAQACMPSAPSPEPEEASVAWDNNQVYNFGSMAAALPEVQQFPARGPAPSTSQPLPMVHMGPVFQTPINAPSRIPAQPGQMQIQGPALVQNRGHASMMPLDQFQSPGAYIAPSQFPHLEPTRTVQNLPPGPNAVAQGQEDIAQYLLDHNDFFD